MNGTNDPRATIGSGGSLQVDAQGDAELVALAACVNALVQLEEHAPALLGKRALQRVLHYLRERFEDE